MRNKIIQVLLIVLLFSSAFSFSQNKKIDSLLFCLKKAKQDTTKINILNILSREFCFSNPDTALHLTNQALKLSEKINYINGISKSYFNIGIIYYLTGEYSVAILNYKKSFILFKELCKSSNQTQIYEGKIGMADCYNNFGLVHKDMGNYDTAIVNYTKSLKIREELSNSSNKTIAKIGSQGVSISYNNLGLVSTEQGNYEIAIDFFLKSLEIARKLNFTKGIAKCLNNIGIVYDNYGNYNKAIEYYIEALKTFEKLGDLNGMSACYNNIGIIYKNQGNYKKALEYYLRTLKIDEKLGDKKGMSEDYTHIGTIYHYLQRNDTAIVCYLKSLKIFNELSDKKGIAACFTNLGSAMFSDKKYQQAIDYFFKSIKIRVEIGDKEGLSMDFKNLAEVYNVLKEPDKAILFSEKSLKIAKEIGSLDDERLAYQSLYGSFKDKNNYKKSLEYLELFKQLNDSIYNTEKHKQISQMEAVYQSEKKQKEIELLNKNKEIQKTVLLKTEAELKQQRILKFAFILGFILMFVLFFVLFRSYRFKKKSNILLAKQKCEIEEKNEELNQQNEEIAAQRDRLEDMNNVLEKKNEEIEKIHNELTDSINYAKRIQESMLPDINKILNFELLITNEQPNLEIQHLPAGRQGSKFKIQNYFVLFKPKDIVSGDFYWTTMVNKWLIITVADCTGHGVPGAFMSMLGISFLNEIVRKEEITKASEVLNHLRESIIEALQQKGTLGEQQDGMDIAFCAINTETLEMQFAGANNPCYIITKFENLKMNLFENKTTSSNLQIDAFSNQLIELKPDKMPIGIHSNMQSFTNQNYQLQKDDTIYLMSDGYEDQFGGSNCKKFLAKTLKNLLIANSQQPMADQKQILETTITEWIGSGEQTDDITILGIKI